MANSCTFKKKHGPTITVEYHHRQGLHQETPGTRAQDPTHEALAKKLAAQPKDSIHHHKDPDHTPPTRTLTNNN